VGATLFVQELDEVSLLTTTFIRDGLAPLGKEFDRRVRLNAIFEGERAIDFGVTLNVGNNTLKTYQHRNGGGSANTVYFGFREEVLGDYSKV
jgi:hypothetical protein